MPIAIVPTEDVKNITPLPIGGINSIYAILAAIKRSADSMYNQQNIDATTTEFNGQLETGIFNYETGPNGPLAAAAKEISDIAKEMGQTTDPVKLKQLGAQLQAAQAKYQEAQTMYEGVRSNADSNVQTMQQQTGSDSSNQKGLDPLISALVSMISNSAQVAAG